MNLSLRHEGWHNHGPVTVRGRAVEESTVLAGADIASRFEAALDAGHGAAKDSHDAILRELVTVAADLTGFYAAIVDPPGDHAYLVADVARSIPLYYDEAGTLVSDDGETVAAEIDASRDPITTAEFLLTRYVTGPDTIWDGVNSTQAGEVVRVGPKPTRHTYREFWPAATEPVEDPVTVLDDALEIAIDRLLAVAGERRIVLPLSGGYDSRLLAAAIAERGHPLTAFTFGRPGHPDVEVSREVADRLDIDWELVAYDREAWASWYHADDGADFRDRAFGGDALPFMAAQLAIRRLLESGRVPRDALVCPGHGVPTAGERLPLFMGEEPNPRQPAGDCGPAVDADEAAEWDRIEPTVSALVDHILAEHYSLWEWEDPTFTSAARERISLGLLGDQDPSAVSDPATAAAAYESWEYRGRATTFTTGDLRGYEAAGLDWWLPLWDSAYVTAWHRLPVADRRRKRAHAELATERYRRAGDVPRDRAGVTDRSHDPVDRILSRTRHTPAKTITHEGIEWEPPYLVPRSAWRTPGPHPLGWYGILAPKLRERTPADRSLYALRTLALVRDLDLSDPATALPGTSKIDLPTE
jgi:asparagine synthase (glutamine-hydrolysing)